MPEIVLAVVLVYFFKNIVHLYNVIQAPNKNYLLGVIILAVLSFLLRLRYESTKGYRFKTLFLWFKTITYYAIVAAIIVEKWNEANISDLAVVLISIMEAYFNQKELNRISIGDAKKDDQAKRNLELELDDINTQLKSIQERLRRRGIL